MVLHSGLLTVVVLTCTPVDLSRRLSIAKHTQDDHVEQRGKRTTAEAQQMAVQEFTRLLADFCEHGPGSFDYRGVSAACSLTCGTRSYTGPVDGLGYGEHGVTVTMHEGSTTGPKVVAKLFKGKKEKENLGHECNILRTLERVGVKDVLTCTESCENNGYPMIIVEPFVPGRKSFLMEVKESYFDSPDAAHKATVNMIQTVVAMLSAGVANIDQDHNVLWAKDGQVTFIDMGLAVDLRTLDEDRIDQKAKEFVNQMLDMIPTAWYNDGRFDAVMREISPPTTPEDVASRGNDGKGIDLAKIFEECVDNAVEKKSKPSAKAADTILDEKERKPREPKAPNNDVQSERRRLFCVERVPESFEGTWESNTGLAIEIKVAGHGLEINHPDKGTRRYEWDQFCVKYGLRGLESLEWEGLVGSIHNSSTPAVVIWNDHSSWLKRT